MFVVSHDRQDQDGGRDRSQILGVLAHATMQVHKCLQQNSEDGYILTVMEHYVTSVEGLRLFQDKAQIQKYVQRVLDDILLDNWDEQPELCGGLFCTGVDSNDNPPGWTGRRGIAPRWR